MLPRLFCRTNTIGSVSPYIEAFQSNGLSNRLISFGADSGKPFPTPNRTFLPQQPPQQSQLPPPPHRHQQMDTTSNNQLPLRHAHDTQQPPQSSTSDYSNFYQQPVQQPLQQPVYFQQPAPQPQYQPPQQPATFGGHSGSANDPIHVQVKNAGKGGLAGKILSWALFLGIGYYLIKRGAPSQFPFNSDIARLAEDTNTTFDDVKGCDEVLAELVRVVDYLQNPEKYTRLGANVPKGILLEGPPGVGKTLLARACAGEAGVPFFYCSASEFEEIFVGLGAKRVRALFKNALENAPCILFIDELDSLGNRNTVKFRSHPPQTLNQFLSELDGFVKNDGVIIMAATNLAKDIDPALLRPGRFDKSIPIRPPTMSGREELFQHFLSKISHNVTEEQLGNLAAISEGMNGASIENIVNQATLIAAETDNKLEVTFWDLKEAFENVLMGPRRLNEVSDKVNQITAFHEAGHAIVSLFTPGVDELLKATIVPRGQALGMVITIPPVDEFFITKQTLEGKLDVAMGGRAAERLVFGEREITTGAGSDFQSATKIASAMVKQLGMVDGIGKRVYSDEDFAYLSDDMKSKIDVAIQTLLNESEQRATAILKKYHKEHKRLAEALLVHKTLTRDEILKVIAGKPLEIEDTEEFQNSLIRDDKGQKADLEERIKNLRLSRDKKKKKKSFAGFGSTKSARLPQSSTDAEETLSQLEKTINEQLNEIFKRSNPSGGKVQNPNGSKKSSSSTTSSDGQEKTVTTYTDEHGNQVTESLTTKKTHGGFFRTATRVIRPPSEKHSPKD